MESGPYGGPEAGTCDPEDAWAAQAERGLEEAAREVAALRRALGRLSGPTLGGEMRPTRAGEVRAEPGSVRRRPAGGRRRA